MAKESATIVSRTYSTQAHEPSGQFQAWREYISPIYDVASIGQDTSAGFPAEVQAWHLGNVLIGRSAFTAHRFFRDQRRVSRDKLTHILVQLCLDGGYAGIVDGQEMAVGAREIGIIDLSRPLALESRSTRTLDVIIPRNLLDPELTRHGGLSGLVLQPDMPTSTLLIDHLLSLGRRIADLPPAAVPAAIRMITTAVGSCVAPLVARETTQRSGTIGMDRVKAYLDTHLGMPTLCPAAICKDLGISRPTLYRMFGHLGGVAAYIQNQRLTQAYAMLVDPGNPHLQTRDVASACGFVSAPHFYRCFRRAFGITPGDARAAQPKRRAFSKLHAAIDLDGAWITQLGSTSAAHP